MTRYQTTYRHKDLGNIDLVGIEGLKADTAEGAITELNRKKPAYITYTRIEKLDDMDARKLALDKAIELAKGRSVTADRVLEVAEDHYKFLTKN